MFLKQNKECVALCITEHWKTYQQLTDYGIDGFNLVASFCREENKNGGCAVYVKCGILCNVIIQAMNISTSNEFECAAVELCIDKTKLIVASIYRPPHGSVRIFMHKMEELLTLFFSHKDSLIIIGGDFNVEMYDDNAIKRELFSLINSFNLFAMVR